MMTADRFLRTLTFASAFMLFPLQVQAQHRQGVAFYVYDSSGSVVGPLLSQNHVGVTVNGQLVSVRFKSPGFNADLDNDKFVTFYYTTGDCSGTAYYSDQADGKWVENDSPSFFDVPLSGVVVGDTPSPLDPNKDTPRNPPEFFSKATIYYPDPAQGLKTVGVVSSRQYGSVGVELPCTPSTNPGPVATMATGKVSFTPPFSAR